jgi:hypothetical protein
MLEAYSEDIEDLDEAPDAKSKSPRSRFSTKRPLRLP